LENLTSLFDVDGVGPITYTWKSGEDVLGYGQMYQLGLSDVGKKITVTAEYTDGWGTRESVTSALTPSILSINENTSSLPPVIGLSKVDHLGSSLELRFPITDSDNNTFYYAWFQV